MHHLKVLEVKCHTSWATPQDLSHFSQSLEEYSIFNDFADKHQELLQRRVKFNRTLTKFGIRQKGQYFFDKIVPELVHVMAKQICIEVDTLVLEQEQTLGQGP